MTSDAGPEPVSFVGAERPRPDWLRRYPRAWMLAVATVCLGAFMGQLDASIVTLTYRPIGASFRAGLGATQWVSLAYLIALAALLVPLGAVSDRLGRKRVYLWGFVLFGLSSLGCAFAPSLLALVGMRAVQGVGAALLQANSVALVATSAPRERLRAALGIQAAAQAVGLAIGPTVGGLLVQTVGWRWVFGVNVPIAVLAVLAGRFLLPRTRFRRAERDAPGLRAIRTAPGVPRALVGALFAYLMLFGPIVLLPAVLQGEGATPLHAGLIVAALPVGFALAAGWADRLLPRRWSSRARSANGLAVTAVGLLGLLLAGADVAGDVPALAVIGLGLGVYTPANNALIMAAVPDRVAALAGGLVNTSRAIGTAAGTAIVAATYTATGAPRPAVAALLAAAGLTALTVAPRAARGATVER
ncbi:MAG: MFS transporter [Jatrophihabitantaceae bacterium]